MLWRELFFSGSAIASIGSKTQAPPRSTSATAEALISTFERAAMAAPHSLQGLTAYARCALVGAALRIGMREDILAADLVEEGVEAIAGFRFRVQRRLQFLNTLRNG